MRDADADADADGLPDANPRIWHGTNTLNRLEETEWMSDGRWAQGMLKILGES
jgi:hypothetical protein